MKRSRILFFCMGVIVPFAVVAQSGSGRDGAGSIVIDDSAPRKLPSDRVSVEEPVLFPVGGLGAMRLYLFDGLSADAAAHTHLAKWMLLASLQEESSAESVSSPPPPAHMRRVRPMILWDGTAPLEAEPGAKAGSRVWRFSLPAAAHRGGAASQTGVGYAVGGLTRDGEVADGASPPAPTLLVERWPFSNPGPLPMRPGEAIDHGLSVGFTYLSYVGQSSGHGTPAMVTLWFCASGSLCTSEREFQAEDWAKLCSRVQRMALGRTGEVGESIVAPMPVLAITPAEAESIALAATQSQNPAAEAIQLRSLLTAHPDWNWAACRALILEIASGLESPPPQANAAAEALRLAYLASPAERRRAVAHFRMPAFEYGPSLGEWMANAVEQLHLTQGIGFIPLIGDAR